MQDNNVITTRERVNSNYNKLPYVNQSKRNVWFGKRRYSNI